MVKGLPDVFSYPIDPAPSPFYYLLKCHFISNKMHFAHNKTKAPICTCISWLRDITFVRHNCFVYFRRHEQSPEILIKLEKSTCLAEKMVRPKNTSGTSQTPKGKGTGEKQSPLKSRLSASKRQNILFDEMPGAERRPSPCNSPRKKGRKLNKSPKKQEGKSANMSKGTNNNATMTLPINQSLGRSTQSKGDLNQTSTSELAKILDLVENQNRRETAKNRSRRSNGINKSNPVVENNSPNEMEIETTVEINSEDRDLFRTEESSDEEAEDRRETRVSGRRVVERDLTTNKMSYEQDKLMKEIDENPALWGLVQRMVNKARDDMPDCQKNTEHTGKNQSTNQHIVVRTPNKGPTDLVRPQSDTTIYTPALKKRRIEQSVNSPPRKGNTSVYDKISNYIECIRLEADEREEQGDDEDVPVPEVVQRAVNEGMAEPGTSGVEGTMRRQSRELTDNMIVEAEQNKAAIVAPKGKQVSNPTIVPVKPILDSTAIDNSYYLATCHVDLATKDKIKNGKFVEFDKLLLNPRRYRYGMDDGKFGFEVVKRDGMKYLVQKEEDGRDNKISNIKKWDEALHGNLYRGQPHTCIQST